MADEDKKTEVVGEGGTPEGDPKAAEAGKETKAESYTIKVNGEARQVTLEEMQALAAKSAGADAKFQDAAKLRKEAEEGIRYRTLIGQMKDPSYTPSEAEVRELAGIIGVDPQEFLEYLNVENDHQGEAGQPDGGAGAELRPEQFSDMFKQQFGMDPAEAKEILGMSHRSHIEEARRQIRAESDKVVDKDEIFGKMMIGERGNDRARVVKEMVAEDVFRRIRDGEPYGPELLAASTQKVRAYLKEFGMPGKPDQYPVTLGLGPSVGLPAEVQSETPIKRVSAADDMDGENFVSRAMQKGLQLLRGQKRE